MEHVRRIHTSRLRLDQNELTEHASEHLVSALSTNTVRRNLLTIHSERKTIRRLAITRFHDNRQAELSRSLTLLVDHRDLVRRRAHHHQRSTANHSRHVIHRQTLRKIRCDLQNVLSSTNHRYNRSNRLVLHE